MIKHKVQTGIAYVVATPIGNPKDITLRAMELLKSCQTIACEDTRVCRDLLKSLDIDESKRLLSYYDQNEKSRIPEVLEILKSGHDIVLISDAGTPNISDPGYHLINNCIENEIPVIGVPGPSSVTLALSICPIGGSSFYFHGFTPEKKQERIKILKKISTLADRIVLFEAPHRILDHLEDAKEFYSGKVFIARELTKKFEETYYDEVQNLYEHFKSTKPLGEFVIIYPRQESSISLEDLKDEIKDAIENNLKPKEVLQKVQQFSSMTRRELYDLITEIKHNLKKD